MEDVLDLYEEEYDRKSPSVCLDEKPVVLHADVHPPVPVEPGKPERVDYEYERRGYSQRTWWIIQSTPCEPTSSRFFRHGAVRTGHLILK